MSIASSTSPAVITPKLANGVIADATSTVANMDNKLNASAVNPTPPTNVNLQGTLATNPQYGLLTQKAPADQNAQNVAYNQAQNDRTQAAMPQNTTGGGTNPTGATTYWQIPGGATVTIAPGQTPPAGSKQTSVDGTPIDNAQPTTGIDSNQQKINDYQLGINQDTQDLAAARNSLNSIINGTYQLNPDELAQIQQVQNQFNLLEQQQAQTNKAYEAGVTLAGERRGMGEGQVASYAGDIKGAVDEGVQKIAQIEATAAKATSDLRQALEDKDYGRINDLYNQINDSMKQKTDAITKINDDVTAAAKASTYTYANLDKLAKAGTVLSADELNKYDQQLGATGLAEAYYKGTVQNAKNAEDLKFAQDLGKLPPGSTVTRDGNTYTSTAEGKLTKVTEKAKDGTLTTVFYNADGTVHNTSQVKPQANNPPGNNPPGQQTFTKTQIEKLQSAGLDKASYTEQLHYLYPKTTPADTKKWEADLATARKNLANGKSWGSQWNYLKQQYPGVTNSQLDQILNKTQYYNQ